MEGLEPEVREQSHLWRLSQSPLSVLAPNRLLPHSRLPLAPNRRSPRRRLPAAHPRRAHRESVLP